MFEKVDAVGDGNVARDGIVEVFKESVNLGLVETFHQLEELVYRPAAVELRRMGCHPVENATLSLIESAKKESEWGEMNDWSKPQIGRAHV